MFGVVGNRAKRLLGNGRSITFSVQAKEREVEKDKRIVIERDAYDEPSTIEWALTARPGQTRFVSITNSGFAGTGDEMVKKALDSTEGFTFVLTGLRALEHNVELNLVRDRFPAAVAESL